MRKSVYSILIIRLKKIRRLIILKTYQLYKVYSIFGIKVVSYFYKIEFCIRLNAASDNGMDE